MLNTFWWRSDSGACNVGDEVTPVVIEGYFNVPCRRTPVSRAELISTGSVLNWVWARRYRLRRRRLGVVGSGFMEPPRSGGVPRFCKVYSVRGELTAHLLKSKGGEPSIGDPGLLASKLITRNSVAKSHRIGLIPHHTSIEKPGAWYHALLNESSRLIDLRTSDLGRVIHEIDSCEMIISEALHGLIIADSLAVPNVWMDDGPLHAGYRFKFHDYFSSVGRPFHRRIDRNNHLGQNCIEDSAFRVDKARLASLQLDIEEAYIQFFSDFGV